MHSSISVLDCGLYQENIIIFNYVDLFFLLAGMEAKPRVPFASMQSIEVAIAQLKLMSVNWNIKFSNNNPISIFDELKVANTIAARSPTRLFQFEHHDHAHVSRPNFNVIHLTKSKGNLHECSTFRSTSAISIRHLTTKAPLISTH